MILALEVRARTTEMGFGDGLASTDFQALLEVPVGSVSPRKAHTAAFPDRAIFIYIQTPPLVILENIGSGKQKTRTDQVLTKMLLVVDTRFVVPV